MKVDKLDVEVNQQDKDISEPPFDTSDLTCIRCWKPKRSFFMRFWDFCNSKVFCKKK